MSAGTSLGELRERIASRLGEPDRLRFPSGWATSTSWRRAQAAPSTIGSVNPGEFHVLLGRESGKNAPSRHRVLFAVYEGDLVAECVSRNGNTSTPAKINESDYHAADWMGFEWSPWRSLERYLLLCGPGRGGHMMNLGKKLSEASTSSDPS